MLRFLILAALLLCTETLQFSAPTRRSFVRSLVLTPLVGAAGIARADEEGGSLFDMEIVTTNSNEKAFDPRAPPAASPSQPKKKKAADTSAPKVDKRLRTTRASAPKQRKEPEQKTEVDPYSKTAVEAKRARASALWGGGGDKKTKRKKQQTFAEQNGLGAIVF